MPDDKKSTSNDHASGRSDELAKEVGVDSMRAVEALGSGIRTTLRNNTSAYGFSVMITAAFGVASGASGGRHGMVLQVLLFAAGAAAAFVTLELAASRWFRRLSGSESTNVVMVAGAIDVLAILAAVGAAAGLAQIPGIGAWAATAYGATLVYLLVGGIDVLVARRTARRASAT